MVIIVAGQLKSFLCKIYELKLKIIYLILNKVEISKQEREMRFNSRNIKSVKLTKGDAIILCKILLVNTNHYAIFNKNSTKSHDFINKNKFLTNVERFAFSYGSQERNWR